MLPEIGGTELLVIAIVALIVVGPKDLPKLLRQFGQFMARVRGMASEFRASFDEMARQSELDELRKEVEAMRRGQFAELGGADAEVKTTISEIEQNLSDVGVELHPPMSYQYDTTEPPPPQAAALPTPEKKPRKPRARKAELVEGAPKPKAPRKPRAKPIVEGRS